MTPQHVGHRVNAPRTVVTGAMGVLRVVTYVLASLASLCVIGMTIAAVWFAGQMAEAFQGFGGPSLTAPTDPGLSDEEWLGEVDPPPGVGG
jgi:hypothetical protein